MRWLNDRVVIGVISLLILRLSILSFQEGANGHDSGVGDGSSDPVDGDGDGSSVDDAPLNSQADVQVGRSRHYCTPVRRFVSLFPPSRRNVAAASRDHLVAN